MLRAGLGRGKPHPGEEDVAAGRLMAGHGFGGNAEGRFSFTNPATVCGRSVAANPHGYEPMPD